jgi:cytochrome oxidase Cu insertion factor (SCO1/SenC/PrrC family)
LTRRVFATLIALGGLAAQAAELPRPTPSFTVNLPGGKKLDLAQLKGKVVVAEFLLVTCPHCQSTARVLAKLQKEYGPRGFQAVGISIDPAADASSFGATYAQHEFPVGTAATRDSVYAYLQHSVMQPTFYVPQVIIIDANGVIREQHGGTDPWLKNEEKNLRATLDKLLAESAAAKKPEGKTRKKTAGA